MRSSLLAALMSATALLPAVAQAQDDPNAGISRRGELRAMREANARESGGGEAPRPERPAPPPQQQQAAPQPAPQPRIDRGADRGGWDGNRGGQRFDRPASAQQQAPQQQPRSDRGGDRGGWDGNRGGQRGDRPAVPQPGGRAPWGWSRAPQAQPGAPGQPPRLGNGERPGAPNWQRGDRRPDQRQQFNRERRFDRGGDRDWARSNSDWRDNGRDRWDTQGRQAWNRDWRRDPRYDWNRYRTGNRSFYRLPQYYAPRGWNYGYRRFGIGFSLSALLFDQSYWIDDPISYRLPPAYGPYRWVRYYNDALLVDVRSGTVVDAIYDIFW